MLAWFRNLIGSSRTTNVPKRTDGYLDRSIACIASFVKTWPDQKLFDVFAFCQDGKMNYGHYCKCLLGVFGSRFLHDECNPSVVPPHPPAHYIEIKLQWGMFEVERAYELLGFDEQGGEVQNEQRVRD